MLRRVLLSSLLVLKATLSQAQLFIEGREVFFDETTHLWLATLPEEMCNGNRTLSIRLQSRWTHAIIDGHRADTTCTFYRLSPQKMYATILSNDEGDVLAGFLAFTTLPIMRLQGHFTNDYTPATVTIADPAQESTLTATANVKHRGGTTNAQGRHKHNYKIDFPDNLSLLQMRKDNKWLLDAGQTDVFRLRNHIATELWNDMGAQPYWSTIQPKAQLGVRGRVVELFLNNQYWGIYSLTENMDRKLIRVKKVSNGQVRGCLWKAEGYENTQMHDLTGPYNNGNDHWGSFQVKYPDLKDNDTTDWSTLYKAVSFVVNSSDEEFRKDVGQYFDIPVLVDFYLLTNVLAGIDNHGKNMLWAVYDQQTDRRLTPLPWDMDCTIGQPWAIRYGEQYVSPYYPLHNAIHLVDRLFSTGAAHFTQEVVDRYRYLRLGCLATDSLIARYERYYRLLTSSGAARRETQRWSGDSDLDGRTIDFDSQIAYITDWIAKRMSYMDGRINYIYRLSLAHASATRQRPAASYSLSGTKMPGTGQQLRPGIYIVGGRKTVVGR